jgi:hypothetical protein
MRLIFTDCIPMCAARDLPALPLRQAGGQMDTKGILCKNEAHVVPELVEWDGPQWLPVGRRVRAGDDKAWNGKNDRGNKCREIPFIDK